MDSENAEDPSKANEFRGSPPPPGPPPPPMTASQTSYGQYPQYGQYGGPPPQQQLTQFQNYGAPSPEFENKSQLVVGASLSLAMNLILAIPNAIAFFVFFFGWWQTLDLEVKVQGAAIGLGVGVCLAIVGFVCFIIDISLLRSINALRALNTGPLKNWLYAYIVYMVFSVAEIILIIVVVKSVDKLIRTYGYYGLGFGTDTIGWWLAQYESFGRSGCIAAAVMGSLFLVVRIYFHYVGFKVRKNFTSQAASQSVHLAASQQIIPQYPVGNDGFRFSDIIS